MSFIIEDGTGVAGATSYATVAQAQAYAADRGLSLPAAEADVQKLLIKACDFLQSLEDQYQGSRTDAEQALAWPRSGVTVFGTRLVEDDAIPSMLIQAQCQLAVDLVNNDLQPTDQGKEVQTETVGPLSTTYFRSGTSVAQPAKALALLEPLFRSSALGLRTFRV
jgi:hypothetical protein